MVDEVRVAVIGASGYTGGELLRILATHSKVEVAYATSRPHAGKKVWEVQPHLRGLLDVVLEDVDVEKIAERAECAFLATPHTVSMTIAPDLIERGLRVIDLSADFRLKSVKVYERCYKVKHSCPRLLEEAVYGLPELHRREIAGARLVANPGCYPTGAILAIAPLLSYGLIEPNTIYVDAKSGTSGAGATPTSFTHHPECGSNVRPYNVFAHRHVPEIEQELSALCGKEVSVAFSPHLVPIVRGILTSVYANAEPGVSEQDIYRAYLDLYEVEPFVRILEPGELPNLSAVVGSNFCDIGFVYDREKRVVAAFSAIDNLTKGASGQAVQNMNIMYGLGETEGLLFPGLWP